MKVPKEVSNISVLYTSPLPLETQAAIGRFITCWAGIESSLCMQVARVMTLHMQKDGKYTLDFLSYIRATGVCMGISPKAALTQIQNMLFLFADEIKPHANKILKIKEKRDTVAHSLSGQDQGGDILFHGFRASAINMGTNKIYSVAHMDDWCSQLISSSRSIDSIITFATGWPNTRIDEFVQQSVQALTVKAQ